MRVAVPIQLTDQERATLLRWSRGRSTPARLILRAKIVLAAAEGKRNIDIAGQLNTDNQTVGRWRGRFAADRLPGIQKDAPRGGRPPTERDKLARRIVEATTRTKPTNATHWSTRTLAAHLGIDKSMVQRVWSQSGLKPHRVRTFKVSNDPRFVEKLSDVVGLYLDPPDNAIVLCVDEKSQIQALDRTQKSLPLKPGRCGTMTHDYVRNGTTTLFAALNVLVGTVISACMPRHRHQEYLKFLRQIDRQTPAHLDLHLIVDNYATHKHPAVARWLKRHPRFHVHFTPTSSSLLNVVERWFRELTDKRIRRGTFTSVPKLVTAIQGYIDDHNRNPKAFVWTAGAATILAKVRRARAMLNNVPSA